MVSISLSPLRVRAVGGADGRGGGEGPAILLCHGFGAAGDDLVGLAEYIDAGPSVRWFFPEAPIELDFGFGQTGRAWWPIDLDRMVRLRARGEGRRIQEETPEGLAPAASALAATLAEIERTHGVRRDRLILGGFSQGAMLATEVALHSATPFAGLAVLSGTVVSEARWRAAAAERGAALHAFVTHGRRDPLLPFEAAEALCRLLEGAGASVDWVPHEGQHEIPEVALERLGAFARRRLG